jgi:hypothetical protein
MKEAVPEHDRGMPKIKLALETRSKAAGGTSIRQAHTGYGREGALG